MLKRVPVPKQPRSSEQPPEHPAYIRWQRARASLDGLSVGDALGERFFGPAGTVIRLIEQQAIPVGPWRYTDDTQMAISVLDTLDIYGEINQDFLAYAFAKRFEERRGYGGGAWDLLRSIRQGGNWKELSQAMFRGKGSFGNGGAMRVAPLGAYFAEHDLTFVAEQARLSAQVTHQHLEGQVGAMAIALAAALRWREGENPQHSSVELLELVVSHLPESLTRTGIETALTIEPEQQSYQVAATLGSGQQVSAQDTVPFSLWCAFHNLDSYEAAFWKTVAGLGDRDTTCAIVGGILASHPSTPPPSAWLQEREDLDLQPV